MNSHITFIISHLTHKFEGVTYIEQINYAKTSITLLIWWCKFVCNHANDKQKREH